MDLLSNAKRFFVFLFLVCISHNCISSDQPPPYQWKSVAENISVALKPEQHRFIDSNITVIENDKFLVIVDANDNLLNAHKLIKDVKQKWDKPVKYVINTHWHSDHILANQLYQDHFEGEQIFIAHTSFKNTSGTKAQEQLEEKRQQWATAIANAKQQLKDEDAPENLAERIAKTEVAFEELKTINLVSPDIFVAELYKIDDASFPIEVHHLGLAHTEGDLVVWLPKQKVLVAGDLFDEISFGGHGFLKDWAAVLERIKSFPIKTVIPGHGSLQYDKTTLQSIQRLLQDAVEQAAAAHKKGLSKEEFMSSINLSSHYMPYENSDELTQKASQKFIPEFFERAYELSDKKSAEK